jgi:hypothetical protein
LITSVVLSVEAPSIMTISIFKPFICGIIESRVSFIYKALLNVAIQIESNILLLCLMEVIFINIEKLKQVQE